MLDTDGSDVAIVAEAEKPGRSGMRPALGRHVPASTSAPASLEDRMTRGAMHEAERRAVRRGVAYARSVASDAGEVAAAAAGVHAELRRVFGDAIRPRV